MPNPEVLEATINQLSRFNTSTVPSNSARLMRCTYALVLYIIGAVCTSTHVLSYTLHNSNVPWTTMEDHVPLRTWTRSPMQRSPLRQQGAGLQWEWGPQWLPQGWRQQEGWWWQQLESASMYAGRWEGWWSRGVAYTGTVHQHRACTHWGKRSPRVTNQDDGKAWEMVTSTHHFRLCLPHASASWCRPLPTHSWWMQVGSENNWTVSVYKGQWDWHPCSDSKVFIWIVNWVFHNTI